MAYEYKTLTAERLLQLALERREALETDHARVSLTNEPAREERLVEFEAELASLEERIADLESSVDADESDSERGNAAEANAREASRAVEESLQAEEDRKGPTEQ